MRIVRRAQSADSEAEMKDEVRLGLAVIGMSLMLCLLWLMVIFALYRIVRITI